MTALLEVKNLRVSFKTNSGNIYAVRGVDFSLYPNETLAIVGESGSGKSALALSLLRLFSTTSVKVEGEVLYRQQNLLTFSEKELGNIRGQEIGMIFQDPMSFLNPTMSIGKQIMEGFYYRKKMTRLAAKEKTLELLHKVGIPRASYVFMQYPHELSGGMKQRVMLAIALAFSPKLLIADEPTTALDATIQAQVLSLLKQLQQENGMSLLFITHDLSLVAGFCQRVVVMYAGKIVESAPVEELFLYPQHPYTKRLLDARPKGDGKLLHEIPGMPPNPRQPLEGCAFLPRCHNPLQICLEKSPPLFSSEEKHHSACWHQDPRSFV